MPHDRTPRDHLTEGERDAVRVLVEQHGCRTAARMLGLHSELTVLKALAGVAIHTLTASTVRARLAAHV